MHPSLKVVTFALDKQDQVFGFGIGIAKEKASLIGKVKTIVDELKTSGHLATLIKKWFKE